MIVPHVLVFIRPCLHALSTPPFFNHLKMVLLTHNVKKIKGDADSINEALHLTFCFNRP